MRIRILVLSATLALVVPGSANGQTDGVEAVTARPGIGTIVTALEGLDGEVRELQSLGRLTPTDIRAQGIGSALEDDEIATFQDALSKNRGEIVEMRKFLTTADVTVVEDDNVPIPLREYLGYTGIAVDDIVALNVTGGSVTLFVDDALLQVRIVETIR